jgi:phosphoribosylaminoimidazolecarboxamide formyltransferase/IMP cyclohydrolase
MAQAANPKIKRALVSVSDKEGIIDFCSSLSNDYGVEIISTGGTLKTLLDSGINAVDISKHTGFPEIMDGRVKTLHPKVHGGILSRREMDHQVMQENGIEEIDLVVVNLYPFIETVSKENTTLELAIENIDIGGPSMVRSAAKNNLYVGVVVEPNDYKVVLEEIQENNGALSLETRRKLAAKAFSHTSNYDAAISNYLNQKQETQPKYLFGKYELKQELRYGENPHQSASFYVSTSESSGSNIASAEQIQGKELSYNNISDTDAAYECVKTFDEPACVIVKHANPCGIALGSNIQEAYEKAFASDETSAFGGIIAFNQSLDELTANKIIENQFVEVIIAPGITLEAQKILSTKENIRLLNTKLLGEPDKGSKLLSVNGGLLIQDNDIAVVSKEDIKVVSDREPSKEEIENCLFAWKVCKFVKSNAIVYTKENQTVGIGAGQMSRIDSAQIAASKALERGFDTQDCAMASDAFFPFRDGIDAAAKIGITSVIQPGGSMRDQEVIDAANEAGMAMLFTGIRHFRH